MGNQAGVSVLPGQEAQRIVMNDAEGLRRRAANLLAMAKKARDDNYSQLADYIFDRAAQLFEEAKIREVDSSSLSELDGDPTLIDKIAI